MARPKRICSIENCGKPHLSRGWCGSHYWRWHKHGDPLSGRIDNGEAGRYFREVVLVYDGTDCLLWPYSCNDSGYGRMQFDGRVQIVSRLACEEEHGPAPTPKHDAAHSCGKGHLACVAKRHMSWKTRAENMADKIVHGTSSRGIKSGAAKIIEG